MQNTSGRKHWGIGNTARSLDADPLDGNGQPKEDGALFTIAHGPGGAETFKSYYGAGLLMETSGNDILRKGILSDRNQEWMKANIRSLLPPREGAI